MTTIFFTLLFCCCFWIRAPRSGLRDPGFGIRDPGSGMGKNQDPGSGINIPDKHPGYSKHPGSATLLIGLIQRIDSALKTYND
jgi:hypothetical protein